MPTEFKGAVREQLSALAHEAWSDWMLYLFDKCTMKRHANGMEWEGATIPGSLVERWMRQMHTPYAELSESEKESDRAEADKVLACFSDAQDARD